MITHAGLANCKLEYLSKSFYVRRYREILGDDFAHLISGEIVSRHKRGGGDNNLLMNDRNIANEVVNLSGLSNGILINFVIKLLINGKFKNSKSSFYCYRISRFIANRILRINPTMKQYNSIPVEIYNEVIAYETSN